MKTGYFVHDLGICETTEIGSGTTIWAFTHVLPGAKIGCNCNLNDHVFVENDVQIGDRVTIKCGVQLWDGITIEDDVFVGPNVSFSNDKFPRSKRYPDRFSRTVVQKNASIGAGAVILPGVTIGSFAMIGAGAVVVHDVPPNSIVYGNPATIKGYIGAPPIEEMPIHQGQDSGMTINVSGCQLLKMESFKDLRGSLTVAEFEKHLPFLPNRQFFVYGVPNNKVRGEHAHKVCAQFLIAVHGELKVVVDDGDNRASILLDSPEKGLLISPGVWGIQYGFSQDAVLAVFASHAYDAEDYIRKYDEFISWVKRKNGKS